MLPLRSWKKSLELFISNLEKGASCGVASLLVDVDNARSSRDKKSRLLWVLISGLYRNKSKFSLYLTAGFS